MRVFQGSESNDMHFKLIIRRRQQAVHLARISNHTRILIQPLSLNFNWSSLAHVYNCLGGVPPDSSRRHTTATSSWVEFHYTFSVPTTRTQTLEQSCVKLPLLATKALLVLPESSSDDECMYWFIATHAPLAVPLPYTDPLE